MSIITVQLGQCGNQIGSSLFSVISDECLGKNKKQHGDFNSACAEIFFNTCENKDSKSDYAARSVLVDSEHKVISQVVNHVRKQCKWNYDSNSQISFKHGSGNNWAHGYCSYGPRISVGFEEAVRRQAEQCDRLSGFLVLMSLAGGTGSGAGSYLTDHLKDHYHHSIIANQVVWPYSSGEVAVQNLNAVLSLAHVYQSADAIIAFDNDSLHKMCASWPSVKKVSFSDVNQILCKQLAFALLPTSSSRPHSSDPLNDFVSLLTPHAEYKMLSTAMAPVVSDEVLDFTTYHWPAILKNLQKNSVSKYDPNKFDAEWQTKYSFELRREKSFAHLLVCRGSDSSELNQHELRNQYFKTIHCYPPFNPEGFNVKTHSKPFCKMDKSALLLSNDCSPMSQFNRVVDRAWEMFTSGAYVHQYKKYGLEEDDFVDCFVTLEQLLCSYANQYLICYQVVQALACQRRQRSTHKNSFDVG